MEISAIRQHLERQDETMKEILLTLRGSIAMGVDGIIQKQREAEAAIDQLVRDVAHLQSWKKRMQEDRGTIRLRWIDAVKTAFAVVGGIGTFVGLLLALKQLFEQHQ